MCLACGRLGSISAPVVYEWFVAGGDLPAGAGGVTKDLAAAVRGSNGNPMRFFRAMVVVCVVNLLMLLFLRLKETGGPGAELQEDRGSEPQRGRVYFSDFFAGEAVAEPQDQRLPAVKKTS